MDTPTPQAVQEPQYQPVQPTAAPAPKSRLPKILAIVLAGLLILGAVSYGAYWYVKNQSSQPTPTPSATVKPGETSVKWRGDGLLLVDLKLITEYKDDLNNGPVTPPDIKYYDMGTNGTNKIVMAVAPAIDPSGPAIFFFEQKPSGPYHLMSKMSSQYIYDTQSKQGYVLASNLEAADATTFYSGVVGPESLQYRGLNLENPDRNPNILFKDYIDAYHDPYTSINKIDTLDVGDLYVRQMTVPAPDKSATFYVKKYIVKLPSGLYSDYSIRFNFFSSNSIPNVTWNNGVKNQDTYRTDPSFGGCGNPGAYVISSRDVSTAVQESGTLSGGEKIYELKDVNDPMMKYFYGLTGGTVWNNTTGKDEKITYQEWAGHHPVIFYKNSLGEYVIFTNSKFGVQAECGKPVIYLYPTHEMNVRVAVGADITKSVPEYGNGWSVLAKPDGTLKTADGGTYSSLFWEGTGHGFYPAVTEGTVVPQSKLTVTLESQLQQLGLSKQEKQDFLEFWLPKMPDTPFVRLTWFTNSQLDELAPLSVWPKPDTTLRVFLDFQGLEKPVSMPAQHFDPFVRKGFTLVEWGGILRK